MEKAAGEFSREEAEIFNAYLMILQDPDLEASISEKIVQSLSNLRIGRTDMYSETIIIQNKTGLHARPAATFVQTASKFKSNITIETETKKGNAKSMLSLLSIGAAKGTSVKISAEGEDEEQAVKALIALIQTKFGED